MRGSAAPFETAGLLSEAPPPPVPISSTFDGGSGIGSITFDRDIDGTSPTDLGTIFRGVGAPASRRATFLAYSGSDTIAIVVEGLGGGPPFAAGWAYQPPPAWILSTLGAPAASFVGFT